MSHMLRALFLAVLFCFSFASLHAQEAPVVVKTDHIELHNEVAYYLHKVEEGHTLYSISRVYEIPISDLVKINPGLSSDLKPGQIIKIPVKPGDAPELQIVEQVEYDTLKYDQHLVLKGETLYRLSKNYNISIADIQKANDGLPGGLKAGVTILVPKKKTNAPSQQTVAVPTPTVDEPVQNANIVVKTPPRVEQKLPVTDTVYITHEVQRRETLYGISRRYDVSMDQIIKTNSFLKERKLNTGDILSIPRMDKVITATTNEGPLKYIDHKVQKDETTWSIAQQYGVSVEDLLAANPDLRKGVKRRRTIRVPVFEQISKPVELKPEEPAVEEMEVGETIVKITGSDTTGCLAKPHQQPFEIALMLPLYLDEETPEDYRETRSLRFLDFYKGVRMAVDSLSGMGMNVNLTVYDVDDDPVKLKSVLADTALAEADLIIGPLFRTSFSRMASFAKQHNIPIVNPLTRADNVIRNNEQVFKVQVPEEIHLKLIAHSIRKNYPEGNIILVRHNQYQDKDRADAIREALKGKLKERVLLPNSYLFNLLVEKSYADTSLHDGELYDTIYVENRMFKEDFLNEEIMDYTQFPNKIHEMIYTHDTIYGFQKYASLARKNIYVTLTDDKVFTMEVLSRLNALKDTFDVSVYTLPGVLDYELETDFLASLDMHIAGSGYLDFGGDDFEDFQQLYFNRWGHYPENQSYACLAWDITQYFGRALYYYGNNFPGCLPDHQYRSLYMNFFFVGKKGQGYENGYASIYRIRDYRFIPEEKVLYSEE